MMISSVILAVAWLSLATFGTWHFVLLILLGVQGAVLTLAEAYAAVGKHSEYIELGPERVFVVGGIDLPLWSRRVRYEEITAVELNDWWSDKISRALLRIFGRPNPPRVQIRFRRRRWSWPLKRMYVRPVDPQGLVSALSARIGAA